MKKLLAILLVLLMLSGCVREAGSTTASPSSTPGASQSTPPASSTPTNPDITGCGGHESDPYEGMTGEEFYADYTVACCYQDALYRSAHGFLSGSLELPGAEVTRADGQPMEGSLYVRNTDRYYEDDGNTYIITDADGYEVMRLYRGGGYITLEEVAAYMYAFGGSADNMPANYSSSKKSDPDDSIWGQYLRMNHTTFKYNPTKYPYEPALPNISGSIGGSLQYYEMDIGTAGYNDGHSITRGAARLVYARQDVNGDGVYADDEVFVFFTHNHYHDFTEYLNYYGGWGETFGDEAGGGIGNPTPYPEVVYAALSEYKMAA